MAFILNKNNKRKRICTNILMMTNMHIFIWRTCTSI